MVGAADIARREHHRQHGQRDQAEIADDVLQLDLGTQDIERDAGLPYAGDQHRQQDQRPEHHEIDPTFDAQGRIRCGVHLELLVSAPEVPAVDDEKDSQQHQRRQQHRREHRLRGPEKIDALQESEEKRRIAQRRQRPTDVGNQEDEENHHVRLVLAGVVGTEQRPNQQHRRTGGSHHAGQRCAAGQQAGIEQWRAVQVALDVDATGGGKQRSQQDHERDVLGDQRVQHNPDGLTRSVKGRERQQEGKRAGGRDLAEMVMPETRDQQRAERDRQQDGCKGQAPGERHRGCVDACGSRRRGRQCNSEPDQGSGRADSRAPMKGLNVTHRQTLQQ